MNKPSGVTGMPGNILLTFATHQAGAAPSAHSANNRNCFTT